MKLPLAEISRRGVFKTLAGYTVASWVLIEVVSVFSAAFLLPTWTVAAVTTFFVLGAFPVLLLSWHYEISSEGFKRDDSRASDEIDRVVKRFSALLIVVIIGITIALWMNFFEANSNKEVSELQQAQAGAPEIGQDGRIRSIAVLPFEDYSEGPSRRLLADGIPEAILHLLAQNKDLFVTARTSSFFFRDKDVTASEIGRILNVQALLEGSIQVSGDRLRVTSQLVRTSDQGHIWSNVYEAPIDDLFEIQDTIATSVRDLIAVRSGLTDSSLNMVGHPNLEAYELLLEAKSLLDEYSRESTERSIGLLRLAIEVSPDYADAHAWLTVALMQKVMILTELHAASWEKMGAIIGEINAGIDKALELDPNNAIAILQKGQVSQGAGGQGMDDARKKALAAAPNDPDILLWAAQLAYQRLEFQNARRNLRRAARVDPGNVNILEAYIRQFCGQEELVPNVVGRLSAYSASAATSNRLKSRASLCDGQYSDAMDALTRLVRIDTEPASAVRAVQVLANLADEKALTLLDDAHKLVPGFFSSKPGYVESNDLSIYFPNVTKERSKTFRWHAINGANQFFFMIPFAKLQIQAGDLPGAAGSLQVAQGLWEGYYAYSEDRVLSWETAAIYALQAWVTRQLGEDDGGGISAADLLEALEQKGLDQWSVSRDQLHDIPLLILLLNGKQQAALDWFRNAAGDRWLGFQAVLTSPMYEKFRDNPEVAEILARLVEWRAGVLAELKASALPEVVDPSLLIEKIESIIPRSDYHLAKIAFDVDRDFQKAAGHFEKALVEGDLSADLLADALRFGYVLGKFEVATELAEYAVKKQPESYDAHYELGFSHFWARRWAKAVESFETAQGLSPESTYLYRWIGIAKTMQGDAAGGLEAIQRLPDGWTRDVGLAIAYHGLGLKTESDAALAELISHSGIDGAFNIAYVLAYRGEFDPSFEWLEKAVDNNNRGLVSISYQPLFKPMHDDPRWRVQLRRRGVAPEQIGDVTYDPVPD